jgi:hypothetical protein
MLVRAGRLCECLIDAVGRQPDGGRNGLDLDQAVVGGLLVRTAKLTRSIFDSTQAEDSEAHSPLSRCLGETAITLRWLVWKSDAQSYHRFRAASFARWRGWLAHAEASAEDEDEESRAVRVAIERQIAAELDAAGVTWDDVPHRPNEWGPNIRQRFEALDQRWVYDTLFVSHSSYVHPSWHEIRAFHLSTDENGLHLDYSYAGMAPIAAFVLARLVVEACRDAAAVLPHVLDADALEDVVDRTIHASQVLAVEFSSFMARGGLERDLQKHSPTS